MREKSNQIGGDHYSKHSIQPFCIIDEYNLDYYEGAALKYLLRHRDKNGKEDLLKLKDYVDCIIDRQYPEVLVDNPTFSADNTWCINEWIGASGCIQSDNSSVLLAEGWSVVKDAYVFSNYLTDEQLKECTTDEWFTYYKLADKYSNTTIYSFEKLLRAIKIIKYLSDANGEFYNSEEILKHILAVEESCILDYAVAYYFTFSPNNITDSITLFKDLDCNEIQLLWVDGYTVIELDSEYVLAYKLRQD